MENESLRYLTDNDFYYDLITMVDCEIDDTQSISNLPSDFVIEYFECRLEPFATLDAEILADMIVDYNEDRREEDGDEYEKVKNAISECVDFEKLNSMMPKLYYPFGEQKTLNKEQIIEILKDNNNE